MRYRYLMCLGICASLFLACKKEYSKEGLDLVVVTPPVADTPVIVATCEYNPYTVGSKFDYSYVTEANDTIAYTLGVVGDTTISGHRFSILSDGYNRQFIRCDNGSYYLFEKGVAEPGYQRPDGFRLYLHDDKPLGGTWADTVNAVVSGQPSVGLLQYTVLEKNSTRTVLGHTYTDVIGVRQDAALLIAGKVYFLNTIATYYYAKKVGYIEVEAPDYKIFMKNAHIE